MPAVAAMSAAMAAKNPGIRLPPVFFWAFLDYTKVFGILQPGLHIQRVIQSPLFHQLLVGTLFGNALVGNV